MLIPRSGFQYHLPIVRDRRVPLWPWQTRCKFDAGADDQHLEVDVACKYSWTHCLHRGTTIHCGTTRANFRCSYVAQMVLDPGDGCLYCPDGCYPSVHILAKQSSERELESHDSCKAMGSANLHHVGISGSRQVTLTFC
jgi:hypothetical protein